jgi:hypothetical protein
MAALGPSEILDFSAAASILFRLKLLSSWVDEAVHTRKEFW